MSNEPLLSTSNLAHMVRVRGGVFYAIEDGISSDRIADPKLRAEWKKMEQYYQQLRPTLEECRDLLMRGG